MALQFPNQQNYLMQTLMNMPPQFHSNPLQKMQRKQDILSGLESKMSEVASDQTTNVYPTKDDWYQAYKAKATKLGVSNVAPSDIIEMYNNYNNEHTTNKINELNNYLYTNKNKNSKKINKELNNNPNFQEWFGSLQPEMQQNIMQTTGYNPYSKPSSGLLGSPLAVPIGVGGYYGGKYLSRKFGSNLNGSEEFTKAKTTYSKALANYKKYKGNKIEGLMRSRMITAKEALDEIEGPKLGKVKGFLKGDTAALFAPTAGAIAGNVIGGDYGSAVGRGVGAGYLAKKSGTSFFKYLMYKFPKIAAKFGATAMADSPGVPIMDIVGLGIAAKDIYDAYDEWTQL